MKKIILIPTRINSKRLPAKALLEIEKIPIIIHTYKRAKLSKLADDVFVCTDSLEIIKICKKFSANYIKTSSKHNNGTERIGEAANKLKLKAKDLIIDVQGDEPLINPKDIDKTIFFFMKNKFDIVVPNIRFKFKNNMNVVKLIINDKKRILWMSRSDIPYGFNEKVSYFNKHLSIIVFNRKSLIAYTKLKKSKFEKIESIELLRALENELLIGSNSINSSSFSVDVIEDYHKAKKYLKNDKIKKKYLM